MTRDQAQPGTRVTWLLPDGTQLAGTVLTPPADQSEHVLVTWHIGNRRHTHELALRHLRRIPEPGR